jgi:hypothetical protein
MSRLTPATLAALQAPAVTVCGLLRIDLPGYTIRLCDGSAVIAWGGDIYSGEDPRFGVIASIGQIDSGLGDAAPAVDIGFMPSSTMALADIANSNFQGARVRIWVAVIDPATGMIIGAPEQVFFGLIDTVTYAPARGKRSVEFQCVSGFERLFANNEGQRLADSFHQNIWPGELGLSNVTGITVKDAWGTNGPPSSVVYSSGGSGLGGGGGYRQFEPNNVNQQ